MVRFAHEQDGNLSPLGELRQSNRILAFSDCRGADEVIRLPSRRLSIQERLRKPKRHHGNLFSRYLMNQLEDLTFGLQTDQIMGAETEILLW